MQSSYSYRPKGISSNYEERNTPTWVLMRAAIAIALVGVFAALTRYHFGSQVTSGFVVTAGLGAGLYLPAIVEPSRRVALWFALFVTPAAWLSFVVFSPDQPLAMIAGVSCVAAGLLLGFRALIPTQPRRARLLTVLAYALVVGGVGLYYAFLVAIFAAAELVA